MRRFLTGAVALLMLTMPLAVFGLTSDARQTLVVDKGTTINGMYVAAGGTLDLVGTFSDDVMVAGGTVTISGPIGGDLLVTGGTVKVTGEVKGGVRILGGTLDLNSKVGRNLVMVGGTLSTGAQTEIGGEALVLGGAATIDGRIAKTLDVWTDALTLNGKVGGHVSAHLAESSETAVQLVIASTAAIGGDLTYYADKDADIRTGAAITGKVTKNVPEAISSEAKAAFHRFFTFARLWNLFSLLVVAALVALVFPKSLRICSDMMHKRKGGSIGYGVLVLLASPIAFVLLPFTLIGFPLMLILSALYLIALYVSQIFLGFVVGSWMMRLVRRGKSWSVGAKPAAGLLPTFLGIVAVSLVFDFLLGNEMLPLAVSGIVGFMHFVLVVWAFGGLLLTKARIIKDHELT